LYRWESAKDQAVVLEWELEEKKKIVNKFERIGVAHMERSMSSPAVATMQGIGFWKVWIRKS